MYRPLDKINSKSKIKEFSNEFLKYAEITAKRINETPHLWLGIVSTCGIGFFLVMLMEKEHDENQKKND